MFVFSHVKVPYPYHTHNIPIPYPYHYQPYHSPPTSSSISITHHSLYTSLITSTASSLSSSLVLNTYDLHVLPNYLLNNLPLSAFFASFFITLSHIFIIKGRSLTLPPSSKYWTMVIYRGTRSGRGHVRIRGEGNHV